MYFVDRNLLDERLDYIEKLTTELEGAEGFALERICHMLIESTVDVGNMIIDGFILRDPGSYLDVIEILKTEGAIPEADQNDFKVTFGWRNKLVREYTDLDHGSMKAEFKNHLDAYRQYKSRIYAFAENDGQAVTAFKCE
ncbi:DUF86 domain-containing protein [Lacicoccus alkaliphilus]|uniref:Uncharacterized conserved protein YutE, UPF0331/DUF86 family n=1 Tax=Lacicoccus alkaliphilus DSM 16010 TaxID=1123231 RepID=A0A1M7FH68_9BACL|nr:DUF86 domain-containing protein [Salinicoccus alkaliphilus]SHM03315.1 Uncharacterized conserved protein YutE, UPF0331/DUF86 family [Salinicoccus alkaliphilus DSM 16010]